MQETSFDALHFHGSYKRLDFKWGSMGGGVKGSREFFDPPFSGED